MFLMPFKRLEEHKSDLHYISEAFAAKPRNAGAQAALNFWCICNASKWPIRMSIIVQKPLLQCLEVQVQELHYLLLLERPKVHESDLHCMPCLRCNASTYHWRRLEADTSSRGQLVDDRKYFVTH